MFSFWGVTVHIMNAEQLLFFSVAVSALVAACCVAAAAAAACPVLQCKIFRCAGGSATVLYVCLKRLLLCSRAVIALLLVLGKFCHFAT